MNYPMCGCAFMNAINHANRIAMHPRVQKTTLRKARFLTDIQVIPSVKIHSMTYSGAV